jgi:hypothetical protein
VLIRVAPVLAVLQTELLRLLKTSDNLSEVIEGEVTCQTALAKLSQIETIWLRRRYPSAIKGNG